MQGEYDDLDLLESLRRSPSATDNLAASRLIQVLDELRDARKAAVWLFENGGFTLPQNREVESKWPWLK